MRQAVIGVGTLTMLISGLVFKLASRIVLAMFMFWVIGFFYPFVAVTLGVPQATFYDFAASIFHPFAVAIHSMYDAVRCVR
jgi:hypothetical protein